MLGMQAVWFQLKERSRVSRVVAWLVFASMAFVGCGGADLSTESVPETAPTSPTPLNNAAPADDTETIDDGNDTHGSTEEADATEEGDEPDAKGEDTEAQLVALGATRQAWEEHHEQASGYTEGAAYGPVLPGGQPTYAAVFGDDRILGYVFHAPAELSDREFLALIEAQELPPDATVATTLDCEDGPIHYFDSAMLSTLIPSATGVYATIERYTDFDFVASGLGVAFGGPSC